MRAQSHCAARHARKSSEQQEPRIMSDHPTGGSASSERLRREAISVMALRAMAQRALPKPIFDFTDGGAEDERTLRRNEDAFAEIRFLPRPLNGPAVRDQSVTLFGKTLSIPVV